MIQDLTVELVLVSIDDRQGNSQILDFSVQRTNVPPDPLAVDLVGWWGGGGPKEQVKKFIQVANHVWNCSKSFCCFFISLLNFDKPENIQQPECLSLSWSLRLWNRGTWFLGTVSSIGLFLSAWFSRENDIFPISNYLSWSPYKSCSWDLTALIHTEINWILLEMASLSMKGGKNNSTWRVPRIQIQAAQIIKG